MIRYFLRALSSQLRSGLSLFVLSLFGVAVGVASVVSIQIINLNALGAFRGSMEAVSGEADVTIVGRLPVLSEELYVEVLGTPGVASAWPLYRLEVALSGRENFFLEIIGVDLFAPVPVPWSGPPVDLAEALGTPGWVAVTPALAEETGFEPGETFEVSLGTRRARLLVGALSDFQKASPLASPRLVVMDISQAQALLGTPGELHQIDVQLDEEADEKEVTAALESRLGDRARVLTPEQREQQASDLLSAFRLNLTALSLISLFVGGFLVYSSTQASLVRRRREFGLLRSLGATRRQVLGLVVSDVILLGLLGFALGAPLGYFIAEANVERVSATISNLYLLEEIHRLEIPLWFYLLAAGVGILGAGAGAFLPALELSRKDTRALLAAFTLHERVGALAPRLFILGALVMAGLLAVHFLSGTHWRPGGFLQAFALIIAVPLLTPLLVQLVTRRIRVRTLSLAYGIKGLGLQLQSTPIAIAALAIAVGMVVGITTMVESFRETLSIWIQTTVQADIYVSTPSWRRARREATLGEEVIQILREHPSVRQVDRLRQFFATTHDRRFSLAGVDVSVPIAEGRFSLLEGEPALATAALDEGAVLIGEPLARKEGLRLGDELEIEGPEGELRFPIAGIYYDYTSEIGSAFMSLETLERHFGAGPINNVALYLEDTSDAEGVVDELRAELSGVPLEIRSNRRLREEIFRIFEQTFAVTRLLQLMSLVIAVCGVMLTLLVMARERLSELALYRALGAERRQIFRVYLGKGLGMGIAGLCLGTATGVAFALILIFVINRAYFGWTIALHWPFSVLAQQAALVLAASGLASLYPAFLASRTPATELRREDL